MLLRFREKLIIKITCKSPYKKAMTWKSTNTVSIFCNVKTAKLLLHYPNVWFRAIYGTYTNKTKTMKPASTNSIPSSTSNKVSLVNLVNVPLIKLFDVL